ncbi:uncharacterized protein LOC124363787 [Homalodisca vitripennis]|uniref:uncharacterized protein LOC124363787 n=1 Tax=Homalodisca vitripennis TaxID=197043 RepID=UPI001EEB0C57|nr:uncharacterized protein LOC124363787 [Homalodisca vitripennis]
MIEWLQRHGESYDEKKTRKALLYEAVQRLKPPKKIYKIDNLLKEKGHTVLRLPPFMCDLNAIEFVWAQVKQYVRHNNASGSVSLTKLLNLATTALDSVTPAKWKNYCDHVQHIEQEYWEKDGITEDAIDEFVIRLGEDDDDSSSSDSSDDPSDPEYDEELAVPLPMDTDTSTENKMFSK